MVWRSTIAPLLQSSVLSVFGEGSTAIVYTPASTGIPETLSDGVFDRMPELVVMTNDVQVQTSVPMLSFKVSALSVSPRARDTVSFGGSSYTVSAVDRDGAGWVQLRLSQANP